MIGILSTILILVGVFMIALMLVQGVRGTVEILCLRNFFLLGFLVFQITSAVLVLIYQDVDPYPVNNWVNAGMLYTVMLMLFISLFLAIYQAGFGMERLAHAIRIPAVHPGPKATLTLAFGFLIGGGLMFGGVNVPYLGVIVIQIGSAFLAISAGLAAWAWVPRLRNVPIAIVACTIILGGFVLLFTNSSHFGRRDMVGLGAALAWGAYFSYWRYLGFKSVLMRFALLGAAVAVFLALVTTTRFIEGRQELSAQQRISNLARGDVGQGLFEIASGQSAAGYSMYFIETRPRTHPYDTLHSLKYFMTFGIPRAIWPSKPDALALTSVKEVSARGRPENWNIGPGLIGHIANDNPFIALPLYALLLAMFFKLLDSLLRIHVANPFVVLAVGVALGQVIALPRGELSNFSVKMVAYLVGAWIAMQIAGRVVGMFIGHDQMLTAEEDWYDQDDGDDVYDEYDEYHDSYTDEYDEYADEPLSGAR